MVDRKTPGTDDDAVVMVREATYVFSRHEDVRRQVLDMTPIAADAYVAVERARAEVERYKAEAAAAVSREATRQREAAEREAVNLARESDTAVRA